MSARLLSLCLALSCSPEPAPITIREPAPPAHHRAPPAPSVEPPACTEVAGLSWPRAAEGQSGVARSNGRGALVQTMADGSARELAFVGGHVFDLLNKLAEEAADDGERRRITCHVLNDAAERGAKVLRIWGSLKRTGTAAEVREASRLLALVLDENARRQAPLRFIVTLQNHMAGYGAPDPSRSLDDQAPGPWRTRAFYLEGGWRGPAALGERVATLAELDETASPYVIAWELVNELDTFRHLAGGRFEGDDADALRDAFLVPAARALAAAVPQPLMLGDIRGHREGYAKWAPTVIAALPSALRARLVWTTHVYTERGRDPEDFMHKLDVDLALSRDHRLPFILGELGQHVPGEHPFCQSDTVHDFAPLFAALARRPVRALLLWGEQRCRLPVDAGRTLIVGAGSDSAEIAESDHATHALLSSLRASWPR